MIDAILKGRQKKRFAVLFGSQSDFLFELASKIADILYWKENWGEPSDEVFFDILRQELSVPNWVLDGNYNRTVPIKWEAVDTVVWVDYGFFRTFYQATKRALRRCFLQQELWVGTGNKESFRGTFLSRKSVLLWTLKTFKSNRLRYETMMAAPEYQQIHFVRLTHPKMAQNFIKKYQR